MLIDKIFINRKILKIFSIKGNYAMKQSIKTGFGVVLTLFLYANFAMGVQTFGPKKYSRSDGSPNVYTDAFKTIAGIGKLIVRNGEYNGQKRVPYAISSARVFLNGTQIFGPNNFNNTVYCLIADINLNENNSITVELASQPGDFLTVSIEQQIPAPVIHSFLSSPENIAPGGSSILTWQTENAKVCAIAPGIGNVEPSG